MQQHGPWQIVQSHEVYRDPWIIVHKDDVIRPDGQPGTHTVAQAVHRIMASEITHGPSCVLILKTALLLG